MAFSVPDSWKPHIEGILTDPGVVVVVGGTDTGKTSLCTMLAGEGFRSGLSTAVVDGDLGQSEIGPPTTVGLGVVESEFALMSDLRPRALAFVGSTTPIGHLLPTAVAVKRLTEQAQRLGCGLVIVDTTGLVRGATAARLKTQKIELLRPKHIIAVQKGSECEHFLKLFDTWSECTVHRMQLSSGVRRKTPVIRTQRRTVRFREYFVSAKEHRIPFDDVVTVGAWLCTGQAMEPKLVKYVESVLGTPVNHAEILDQGVFVVIGKQYRSKGIDEMQEFFRTKSIHIVPVTRYKDLVVGLQGEHLETLALGLLKELDFPSRTMTISTPLRTIASVKSIKFGSVKVRPDGVEVGQLRPGEV